MDVTARLGRGELRSQSPDQTLRISTTRRRSVDYLDLKNLAARRTETKVRNVQGPVGAKGEASGKEEGIVGRAVDPDLLLAIGQYADKTTRCRYRTRGTR